MIWIENRGGGLIPDQRRLQRYSTSLRQLTGCASHCSAWLKAIRREPCPRQFISHEQDLAGASAAKYLREGYHQMGKGRGTMRVRREMNAHIVVEVDSQEPLSLVCGVFLGSELTWPPVDQGKCAA